MHPVFTLITNTGLFSSVTFIPIGSSGAIYALVTMVIGITIGMIFLKEQMNPAKWIAVALSLIGCTCVTYAVLCGHVNKISNINMLNTSQNTYLPKMKLSKQLNATAEETTATSETYHNIKGATLANQGVKFDNDSLNKFTSSEISNSTTLDKKSYKSVNSTTLIPEVKANQTITFKSIEKSLILGIILAASGGLGGSIYIYLSKLFSNRGYHYSWITFWSSNIQGIYSLIMMLSFETIVIDLTIKEVFLVLGHSVLTGIGLVAHYAAICKGDVNVVCILLTAEIPMKVFVQFLIFPDMQIVHTNWLDIFGAALVVIATILLPLHEIFKDKCSTYNNNNEEYMLLESKE